MSRRLQDRVAIITGAGSIGPGWGNGKSTAVLFAREGAKVFAVDVNPDAVAETKGIIDVEGGACTTHEADVSRAEDVAAVVQRCLETYGRIDVLHNNVGINQPHAPIGEVSEETWDRIIDVNVKSVYLMCREVVPHMERQGGGVIVNVSSVSGLRSSTGRPTPVHNTSKAAIFGLTRSIATDHARAKIRCNVVVPGSLNTPLGLTNAPEGATEEEYQAWLRMRDERVPLGRAGTGWDIAKAVLFLASDDAEFITGTQLIVDGGLSCLWG